MGLDIYYGTHKSGVITRACDLGQSIVRARELGIFDCARAIPNIQSYARDTEYSLRFILTIRFRPFTVFQKKSPVSRPFTKSINLHTVRLSYQ
jgi:hypothetical protein